jgi:two-component system chemotaxis response regulator CheY
MARILVIEDEPVIAQIIRLLLEPHGHDVLIADDGSRGFAAAQRQGIDLIILDLMMPVMDGYSALEALRGNERTATIPVMVLSARSDAESQRRCQKFGVDTYLQKPFASEGLIQAVENLVASPIP